MIKVTPNYEDLVQAVVPDSREFVQQAHEFLLQNNCKLAVKAAASGPMASYSHMPDKRVIANFVLRKTGLMVRIYGDNFIQYPDFLQTLPPGMVKAIGKAPECKRLNGTGECNSRCGMGYDFFIGDTQYKKCRYNCFLFPASVENMPFITEFLVLEIKART